MQSSALVRALAKDVDPAVFERVSTLWPGIEHALTLIEKSSGAQIRLTLNDIAIRTTDLEDAGMSDSSSQTAGVASAARDFLLAPLGRIRIIVSSTREQGQRTDDGAVDSTARLVEHILTAFFQPTFVFHQSAMNMAHELSVMLIGLGLFVREFSNSIVNTERPEQFTHCVDEMAPMIESISAECQLGLFVARNFLSNLSPDRYQRVVRHRHGRVDLNRLLLEVLALHRPSSRQKRIEFDLDQLRDLPPIFGDAMELRRAFHNLISNAVKYSYHSVDDVGARRVIRVRSRDPYDPGFRQYRIAVEIENYGLGLAEDELARVGSPGFRGRQAIAEVPIGSGIGLSEVRKIVSFHDGVFRLRSVVAHSPDENRPTYVTTARIVLPVSRKSN